MCNLEIYYVGNKVPARGPEKKIEISYLLLVALITEIKIRLPFLIYYANLVLKLKFRTGGGKLENEAYI